MRLACTALLLASCATAPAAVAPRGPPASTGVVVVGGGLAGLVTAYELKKRGVELHLLEASPAVGGRVQTARYPGGLYAEYGLQELWASNPLVGIARELGVPLEGGGTTAFSSVLLGGKLYPLRRGDAQLFADLFSDDERAKLNAWLKTAEEALRAPPPGLRDQSFAQWVRSFGLGERAEAFIRVTLECEVGTAWDAISAEFGLLEFHYFLGGGEPNYQVVGGNARLVEALAARVADDVSTTVAAERIVQLGDRVRVDWVRGAEHGSTEARAVVVAIPPWRLHQLQLDPPLPDAQWESIRSLLRGSYTVVHLVVDRSLHALTEVRGASPFPVLTDGPLGVLYGVQTAAPEGSPHEVFSLLVHGGAAYAFHMQPREKKLREVLDGLDALWPGFSQHVRGGHVYTYHPGAITAYPVGRSPLDAQAAALRQGHGRVHFVGDWLWSGHSDGAARSALEVAARLAPGPAAR